MPVEAVDAAAYDAVIAWRPRQRLTFHYAILTKTHVTCTSEQGTPVIMPGGSRKIGRALIGPLLLTARLNVSQSRPSLACMLRSAVSQPQSSLTAPSSPRFYFICLYHYSLDLSVLQAPKTAMPVADLQKSSLWPPYQPD